MRRGHKVVRLTGACAVVALALGAGCYSPAARADEARQEVEEKVALASAVFAVRCYDVGKAALRDAPGVASVTSGWHGREEVNRVRYDPKHIDVAAMVERLRASGTFIRVVEGG